MMPDWKDPQVERPNNRRIVLVERGAGVSLAYLVDGVWYEHDFLLQCATIGALEAIPRYCALPPLDAWQVTAEGLPAENEEVVIWWGDRPVLGFLRERHWWAQRGLVAGEIGKLDRGDFWLRIERPWREELRG